MGRPINKKYIGNTSQTGQQIQATARFAGSSTTSTAYIVKQVSTSDYNMANVAGGSQSGVVTLVNGGVALNPGEANISVTPYGTTGSGATATATLGFDTVTLASAGSGSTANYYVPNEIIFPSSGTPVVRGNIRVNSVKLAVANVVAGGPGYTVGDTFTWGYAGYTTPAVATVASVTGNGNIATMSITTAGVVTNTSVTNTTVYSTSSRTNAWATNASFSTRWDINELALAQSGSYSTAPSNPVALTGSALGTGATVTATWEVSGINVTAGGIGYKAVSVTVAGNATAIGAVNAAGNVNAITVTARGSGYTNTPPTVTVSPVGVVQYAKVIKNQTVTTWSGNTYDWVMSDVTLTSSNQAQLRSA